MGTTKLNIGKIPISKGEYQEGTTYQRLNQVTMLGSTYQSKIDDNTSAPAQMGADGAVENINTDKWLCVAVGNVSAAKKVVYNNETSGLEAGNVQEAIDETNTKVSDLSKSFPSIFNNGVTFIPLVLAHEFTAINQSINIKTASLSGNFRLLVIANIAKITSSITISITDVNGIIYKVIPDISYKNRFVFDLESVSGLSKIIFGTYGKQEATFKPCVVSAVLYNKNTEDFVDIWKDIDNGKANKSEVDSLVKKIEDKISSNEGTTIECSESFICPVGETIQIFYKSIFNGININDFIISCRSNVGKSYPRYFEYKPTELGNKSVTFNLCKFDGYEYKVVSTKAVTIECIEHPKSSTKNILIIGDSLTLYNSMQDEILRRINKEGGEPEGYKLACNFLLEKNA